MQQTRGELLDEFLAYTTEQHDAESRRIAESVLNRSLQSLWMKHPWVAFFSLPAMVRTAPGQASYSLPTQFGRLGAGKVRNLTLGRELYQLLPDDYDRAIPVHGTPLDTRRGHPAAYILAGVSGVQLQPALTGWELEVSSSDTGDTDVLVSLLGRDVTGRQKRAQVLLTGAAPLALGTWAVVDEFSKSYQPNVELVNAPPLTSSRGTVTLSQVTTAVVLDVLGPAESALQYPQLLLDPPPDGAYDISVPMIRAVKRLTADSDQLPAQWGPALFEDMVVSWRVNTGELGLDANIARPCFLDLVAYDNSLRAPRSITPFGVAR